MKMDLKKFGTQAVESTIGTRKMQMADDCQAVVFQIFTKNIYSNPIGTVVREITSNCFDSHIEAQVDSPVVIRKSFDKVTNTHYISFIDYGVGISPERMQNIYGVFFKSTKNADNTQIGGFGIGGKTPLAYKRSTGYGENEYDNSYSIITNYNGIRYEYIIYEGDECPEYSDPIMSETTEHNGTEVRITVLEKDIQNFKREMVRQLYYFENVVFEGFVEDEECKTSVEEVLTNEYQIIRAKTFLFRGSEYAPVVHVCLGRVAYPLDYNVLGLDSGDYRFPVAIRLEIGEIKVTASRETLDYSEGTIKILKKKLEAVKTEIKQMLGKQYENIVTLEDYFKVKNQFGELVFPNGNSFNVGRLIEMKDIDFSNFKYSFTKMPNDKQLFRLFFEAKLYGKKPRSRRNSWRNDGDEDESFIGSYEKLAEKRGNLFYYIGEEFQRKLVKQAWLKNQHTTYHIIGKKKLADKFNMNDICALFNVHDDIVVTDANGVETATPFVQSLEEMQNEYFELVMQYCTNYDDVIVPQDFIDSRKQGAKKLSEEFRRLTIPVKMYGGYRGSYRVKLDALFNLNVPIFYGTKEQEDELRSARHIFSMLFDESIIICQYNEHNDTFRMNGKKGIIFLQISAPNIRYMEYCKNAKPISKFKGIYMHRRADAIREYFQSQNFVKKFEDLNELYKCKEFAKISPEWGKKIQKISKFVAKLSKGDKENWYHYKDELSRYYDLTNIQNTKEQEAFISTIDELYEMQEVNEETLQYIDMPWHLEDAKDSFWNLLKKVLVY
jgi:hypothetical protein